MMREQKLIRIGMGVCLMAMLSPMPVLAQDQVPSPPPVEAVAEEGMPGTNLTVETLPADTSTVPAASSLLAISAAKQNVRDASVTPESVQTLFFTAWQHALLQDAKIGFKTALPMGGPMSSGGSAVGRDPGIREISLGGIAFSSHSRWTVWLNGVRITPDAIPQAVMDIKVSRHHIDLKWFDGYTNKIYPIRLRPQERCNLDSRIFLPGTGAM
jgi:hypothetical protein